MALGKNIKSGTKGKPAKAEGVNKEIEQKASIPVPKDTSVEPAQPEAVVADNKNEKNESQKSALEKLNHELETDLTEEDRKMLVVFPVGSEEYAFEIDQIKEVVPVPPISVVPQTKKYVLGVANVRGNVLAVMDLARKFRLKKQEEQNYVNYVIVIKSDDVKVAVASTQVPETLMVTESQIDSTTDVMRKSNDEQGYIKGIIKKENRMIIFIDVIEMVENEQSVNV